MKKLLLILLCLPLLFSTCKKEEENNTPPTSLPEIRAQWDLYYYYAEFEEGYQVNSDRTITNTYDEGPYNPADLNAQIIWSFTDWAFSERTYNNNQLTNTVSLSWLRSGDNLMLYNFEDTLNGTIHKLTNSKFEYTFINESIDFILNPNDTVYYTKQTADIKANFLSSNL